MPAEKTRSFCPCDRALNMSGKGLKVPFVPHSTHTAHLGKKSQSVILQHDTFFISQCRVFNLPLREGRAGIDWKPSEQFFFSLYPRNNINVVPANVFPRSHSSFLHQFALCREIITLCSQIHTKHTNTLCGQNVECRTYRAVYTPSRL